MRSLGRRLQALATVVGVAPFAVSPAQAQQAVNLAKCWIDVFDPKDPAQTAYYYNGSFPIAPTQGVKTKLGAHLTDQVSVAVAPKRVQLDPARAKALPIADDQDQDTLLVELRPDEQNGFALKATTFHRPFHPSRQPQALEMFALRKSDQAVLARSGSVAPASTAADATGADGAPNLELGANMLAAPFTIVILDERGDTYYQADYAVDVKILRQRASIALATGRKLYEGAAYDAVPGTHGGLDKCSEGDDDEQDVPCFLTTATVRVIGLDDDCWELRQLRAFRDRYAALGARQQAAMQRYYVVSPPIVRAIDARGDSTAIWLRVYFAAILPAAIAALFRRDRLALAIYRRLVATLLLTARAGG